MPTNLLSSALKLLPMVGPVMAALPEFKELFSQLSQGLSTKDQDTLKAALAAAQKGSAEAHFDLQRIVAEATGE